MYSVKGYRTKRALVDVLRQGYATCRFTIIQRVGSSHKRRVCFGEPSIVEVVSDKVLPLQHSYQPTEMVLIGPSRRWSITVVVDKGVITGII